MVGGVVIFLQTMPFMPSLYQAPKRSISLDFGQGFRIGGRLTRRNYLA